MSTHSGNRTEHRAVDLFVEIPCDDSLKHLAGDLIDAYAAEVIK